jgi:hypothetical protein
MADVHWLVGGDTAGPWSLANAAGVVATWPDRSGEVLLAKSSRRAAPGMAALFAAADGQVSLAIYDLTTNPRVVPLAGLTSRELGAAEDDKSFAELCTSRTPVWRTGAGIASMSRWQLVSNAAETEWFVLVATCGYVDTYGFDAAGQLIRHEVRFEPAFDVDVTRMFLALNAELRAGDGDTLAAFLIEDDPSDYQQAPAVTTRLYLVGKVFDVVNGFVHGFAVDANVRVFAFATDGGASGAGRAVLVGTASTPTPGIPNDTDQDDGWIGIGNFQGSATLQTTQILHHARDDYFRAVTFAQDGVVVVGDTDRHHVDSGSWDGGSQVIAVRYDSALSEQERIVFGEDRMDTAYDVLATSDGFAVSGKWNAIPNNHLPAEENWFQGFAAFLPLQGWTR